MGREFFVPVCARIEVKLLTALPLLAHNAPAYKTSFIIG